MHAWGQGMAQHSRPRRPRVRIVRGPVPRRGRVVRGPAPYHDGDELLSLGQYLSVRPYLSKRLGALLLCFVVSFALCLFTYLLVAVTVSAVLGGELGNHKPVTVTAWLLLVISLILAATITWRRMRRSAPQPRPTDSSDTS